MTIDRWLLIIIAGLAVLDAWHTRKVLNEAEHELDQLRDKARRESARALGVVLDDDD
jgi:hypothetical protein